MVAPAVARSGRSDLLRGEGPLSLSGCLSKPRGIPAWKRLHTGGGWTCANRSVLAGVVLPRASANDGSTSRRPWSEPSCLWSPASVPPRRPRTATSRRSRHRSTRRSRPTTPAATSTPARASTWGSTSTDASSSGRPSSRSSSVRPPCRPSATRSSERRGSQPNQWVVPVAGYRMTARFGQGGGLWSRGYHTGPTSPARRARPSSPSPAAS